MKDRYCNLRYFGKLGLCLLITVLLSLFDSPIDKLFTWLFASEETQKPTLEVIVSKYITINLLSLVLSDLIIDKLSDKQEKETDPSYWKSQFTQKEKECKESKKSLKKLSHSYMDLLSKNIDRTLLESAYKDIKANINILEKEDIEIITKRYSSISSFPLGITKSKLRNEYPISDDGINHN